MNASIGTAIANKDTTPSNAGPINPPMSVNGRSISEQVATRAANAKALVIALSIPSARANTPTNANKGTAIAVKTKTPFRADPIRIPPATFRATAIATIRADKPSAASIPSWIFSTPIVFKASTSPLNTEDIRLTSASTSAGACPERLLITPIRSSNNASVI